MALYLLTLVVTGLCVQHDKSAGVQASALPASEFTVAAPPQRAPIRREVVLSKKHLDLGNNLVLAEVTPHGIGSLEENNVLPSHHLAYHPGEPGIHSRQVSLGPPARVDATELIPQDPLATNTSHPGGGLMPSLEFLVRISVVLVAMECALALAFECLHHRIVDVDVGQALPQDVQLQQRPPLHHLFKGTTQLMGPYFSSAASAKGRACCLCILLLGMLSLFFAYFHNLWQKEWWDLFNKADASRFPRLMGAYALLAVAWMLTNVYIQYLRSWLYIDWREFMTRRLMRRWLAGHAHFLLQLGVGRGGSAAGPRMDNPGQRIQEDIHLFVSTTVDIVPDFMNSLGNLLVFVPVMLANEPVKAFGVVALPGWLLYFSVIYALLGILSTHLIGSPMINYNFARQKSEADFRHLALHVQDNAESVALYNSELAEEENLQQQFERIKYVQWRQMMVTKRLTFFTSTFGFVQFLVPFFILAPSYFKKDLSLGGLFQLNGAISSVASALDWFIRVYGPIADWRATADRLLSFEEVLDSIGAQAECLASAVKQESPKFPDAEVPDHSQRTPFKEGAKNAEEGASALAAPPPEEERGNCSSLRADLAEVRLPSGDIVWRDVHIDFLLGQRVLISGPEGSGKSVLFKSLAGVWPYVAGRHVQMPVEDTSQVLFVPQRPALPKRCSLAQALAYPESRATYSDELLLQAIQKVSLEDLLSRPLETGQGDLLSHQPATANQAEPLVPSDADTETGSSPESTIESGLNRVANWSLQLSPGQQQRLALGHVLLRRPRVLFLDEATSNVGKEAAIELYSTIIHELSGDVAIISISHDVDTLAPLHDLHLAVQGTGALKELCVKKGQASVTGRGH